MFLRFFFPYFQSNYIVFLNNKKKLRCFIKKLTFFESRWSLLLSDIFRWINLLNIFFKRNNNVRISFKHHVFYIDNFKY